MCKICLFCNVVNLNLISLKNILNNFKAFYNKKEHTQKNKRRSSSLQVSGRKKKSRLFLIYFKNPHLSPPFNK